MSKTLIITDDKVKEAAEKCSDARAVLKTLFPEAFGAVVVDVNKIKAEPQRHTVGPNGEEWFDIHLTESDSGKNLGYLCYTPDKGIYLKPGSDREVKVDATSKMGDGAVLFRVIKT